VTKFFVWLLTFCILISGCSKSNLDTEANQPQSSSPKPQISSWQSFYEVDENNFDIKIDNSGTKGLREWFEKRTIEYDLEILDLEELVKDLNLNSSTLNIEQSQSLKTGLRPIEELISSLNNLVEDLKFLVSVHKGTDCTYYGQNITKCGNALAAFHDYNDVHKFCALAKASNEFEKIEGFEFAKSAWLSSNPDHRTACFMFPDSHLVYGHPKTVPMRSIPSRIQNWFDDPDNRFAIQIADGLWATQTMGISALEAFIYASWTGYCAPFRKYERLLSEFGLDDGFKAGSCG